ncbi:MAG: hypothetical protein U1F26_10475 [Lysobacterales bacterium]
MAADLDATAIGLDQSQQQPDRCGLAGTVRAQKTVDAGDREALIKYRGRDGG